MFDNDDFEDFIENLKDYLDIDEDNFDIEFYISSKNELNNRSKLDSENNGFKISYHYEEGMDEPNIKIQGDIDEKELNDYLKNLDLTKIYPKIRKFNISNTNQDKSHDFFDTEELSIKPNMKQEELSYKEPYIEVHNLKNFIEILLEAPGIKKDDILITLNGNKKTLIFEAENSGKRYHKKIKLPYKISIINESLDFNNGLIIFKCKKI